MQRLVQVEEAQMMSLEAASMVWVEGDGPLSSTQLDEALGHLERERLAVEGLAPTVAAALSSSFAPAAAHHSYETLLALPSVTMLKRQRELLQVQHARLQGELGAIDSSPVMLHSTYRLRTEEFATLSEPTSSAGHESSPPPEDDPRRTQPLYLELAEQEGTEAFVRRTVSADEMVPLADDAPTHDEPPSLALRSDPSFDPVNDRYELGEELGKGGGGRVVRAFDRVLGRYVAMKIMRPEPERRAERLARFMAEAQTTGQLEHPNIVPIYDFGTLTSGDVYYTMREVRNTSLRKVLSQIREGDDSALAEYSLQRMMRLLEQVCLALGYAHAQGVVHRDLKPDNIMLGDYGEVLLMDWGLARHFDLSHLGDDAELTAAGKTMGTPAYMPPEQARGELDEVDALSDIYSVGAILYEILTLEPPFVGDSPLEVMFKVVEADLIAPSARSPFRDIPEELERICLRALAPPKHLRFQSAKALFQALDEWVEGLQPREAARRATDGEAWGRRYRMLRKEGEALMMRVRTTQSAIEPWAPIVQKRALWSLEDRLHRFNLESARAFGHAVANFTQALVYMPDNIQARDGLADLYWARCEQARQEDDPINALYFKALVYQYDDRGHYKKLLSEQRELHIVSEPPGAEIELSWVRERDRRFVIKQSDSLGPAPISLDELATGRYLLSASLPDRPAVRYPLHLDRTPSASITIPLPRSSCYLEGFVLIPRGPFLCGGDPKAFNPSPEREVELDSFFCSIFPVTFREYLAWIDALYQVDPDRARSHVPQLRNAEGALAYLDRQSGKWTPDAILIEGPARQRYPHDAGHEWELPVIGINHQDATAYASFRAEQSGFPLRLPSREELEKAGRGTDGRFYTWGNRFDATFCKMRTSRAEPTQLEPVGSFLHDVSPFGVRDLSGGVQEWCGAEGHEAIEHPVFGGSWSQDDRASRLAGSIQILATSRTASIGMRLVYSLSDLSK